MADLQLPRCFPHVPFALLWGADILVQSSDVIMQHSGENIFCGTMQNHTTLRDVLNDLGPQSLKVAPRRRGTAKTELEFIEAAAPEYLDRPALAAPAPAGEILVLVQCTEPEKWTIYGAFVSLPF